MPSLLNTVGKMICYDFEMHGEQGIKGVHKKRSFWLKLEAKDMLWFSFILGLNFISFVSNSLSYITVPKNKIK